MSGQPAFRAMPAAGAPVRLMLAGVIASLLFMATTPFALQDAAQRSESADDRSQTQPPPLPSGVQAQMVRDQRIVEGALRQLADADLVAAIDSAARVLSVRTAGQGNAWWETVDARLQWEDLRRFSAMSREDREAVAQLFTRIAQFVDERGGGAPATSEAIDEGRSVVDDITGLLGANDRRLVDVQLELGEVAGAAGYSDRALEFLEAARASARAILGEAHPRCATVDLALGSFYSRGGRYSDAEPALTRGVEAMKRAFRTATPDYADGLSARAEMFVASRRVRSAIDDFAAAARAYEVLGSAYDVDRAWTLSRLALAYQSIGNEPAAAAALSLASTLVRADGVRDQEQDVFIEIALTQTALSVSMGKLEDAQRQSDEVIGGLATRPGGPETLAYANALDNRANILRAKALFPQAEPWYREELAIRQRQSGADAPDYLQAVSKLASLHVLMGQYGDAFRAYEAVLESLEVQHIAYPVVLNELGFLCQTMANPRIDATSARQSGTCAADVLVRLCGAPQTGSANDSSPETRYAPAASCYERAIGMWRKVDGERPPAYVTTLHNLAYVEKDMGERHYADAERHFLEAQALIEARAAEQPPDRHPLYATLLDNLARLYIAMHRAEEGLPLVDRALRIRKELYGAEHPAYATSLSTRASVLAASGRLAEATQVLVDSAQSEWTWVTSSLPLLSDEQKTSFLDQNDFLQGERIWSLVFEEHQDAELGVRAALLRKHLLFEATRQESAALRAAVAKAPLPWREMLGERNRLRSELAAMLSQGLVIGRSEEDLNVRLGVLEERLRRDNPAYRLAARLQQIGMEDVARALRPGQALVEYVTYHTYDFGSVAEKDEKYGALVVRPDLPPVAIPLTSVSKMDAAIADFRGGEPGHIAGISDLANELTINRVPFDVGRVRASEARIGRASSEVRILAWDPLRDALSGIDRVYIAPDGALSLVPFEVLAEKDDIGKWPWKYLVEQIEIVYVPTGRDLGRLSLTIPSEESLSRSAVLIGNPDFDLGIGDVVAPSQPIGSGPDCAVSRAWEQVSELTNMVVQARSQLEALGYAVTTLINRQAVEGAILRVKAPGILQFATHGQFIPCNSGAAAGSLLARSTLMLAGANTWRNDRVLYLIDDKAVPEPIARAAGVSAEQLEEARLGDGVLTAYEVSAMDLTGTQLVNLTACETGLGQVTANGVAGLRQAFLWAGARSLTMSMWKMPTVETKDQISEFYERWLGSTDQQSKISRYAAFRASQRAALTREREGTYGSGNPLFWAGTVFVGDPGDLPSVNDRLANQQGRP